MTRFIGDATLEHVRQPDDTNFCFAGLAASVLGEPIEAIAENLGAAFLSEEDGATDPFWEPHTEVVVSEGQKILAIDCIQGYNQEAADVAGVITNIDAVLQKGTPVALCYRKTDDPESGMHWILVTGYNAVEDTDTLEEFTQTVSIIDPLQDEKTDISPAEYVAMIDRSIEGGVFAYALSVKTPEVAERESVPEVFKAYVDAHSSEVESNPGLDGSIKKSFYTLTAPSQLSLIDGVEFGVAKSLEPTSDESTDLCYTIEFTQDGNLISMIALDGTFTFCTADYVTLAVEDPEFRATAMLEALAMIEADGGLVAAPADSRYS